MTVLLTLGLLVACGEEEEASDSAPSCTLDPDGAYPTWGTFGAGFFLDYCASCHAAAAPQRFGAPDSLVFDTEADVLARSTAVRRSVLEAQTMPVGGGVPDVGLESLARYLDCLEAGP